MLQLQPIPHINYRLALLLQLHLCQGVRVEQCDVSEGTRIGSDELLIRVRISCSHSFHVKHLSVIADPRDRVEAWAYRTAREIEAEFYSLTTPTLSPR